MGAKAGEDEAAAALEHLQAARHSAAAVQAEAQRRQAATAWQIQHADDVAARFVRRRNQLLEAGEANTAESRPAAELAGTAERLRRGIERIRSGLLAAHENAAAQARQAAADLARIDASLIRLADAMKSLELVKLEQASKNRLDELERSGFERLQQLGRSTAARGQVPAPPGPAAVDVEFRVREVNRLAYEAEALADLQRERL